MPCWRSGLTHIPLKDTFMDSNPVWVTIIVQLRQYVGKFQNIDVFLLLYCIKPMVYQG